MSEQNPDEKDCAEIRSHARVRRVLPDPNPLFTRWLRDWCDEAKRAGKVHVNRSLERALRSLRKFPLPLESGRDCMILQNFGQKICEMLDKKLAEHRLLHPDWNGRLGAKSMLCFNKLRLTRRVAARKRSPSSNAAVLEKPSVISKEVARKQIKLQLVKQGSMQASSNRVDTMNGTPSSVSAPACAILSKNNLGSTTAVAVKAPIISCENLNIPGECEDFSSCKPNKVRRTRKKSALKLLKVNNACEEANCAGYIGQKNRVSSEALLEMNDSDKQILKENYSEPCLEKELVTAVAPLYSRSVSVDVRINTPIRNNNLKLCRENIIIQKSNETSPVSVKVPSTTVQRRLSRMTSSEGKDALFDDLPDAKVVICLDDTDDDIQEKSPQPVEKKSTCHGMRNQCSGFSKVVQESARCSSRTVECLQLPSSRPLTVSRHTITDSNELFDRSDSMLDNDVSSLLQTAMHTYSPQDKKAQSCIGAEHVNMEVLLEDSIFTTSETEHDLNNKLISSNNGKHCEATPSTSFKRVTSENPVTLLLDPPALPESSSNDKPNASTLTFSDDDDLPPLVLRVRKRLHDTSDSKPVLCPKSRKSPSRLCKNVTSDCNTNRHGISNTPVDLRSVTSNIAAARVLPGNVAVHLSDFTASKDTDKNNSCSSATSQLFGILQDSKKTGPKICSSTKDFSRVKALLPTSGELEPVVPSLKYTSYGSRRNELLTNTYARCEEPRCFSDISFSPGTFQIFLCVDCCEVTGGVASKGKQKMIEMLRATGVPMLVRKLAVGDFTWLARKGSDFNSDINEPLDQELVLGYVVERKRSDDLAASIRDGRYAEQKHRLSSLGVQRCIYLIENSPKPNSVSMSDNSLLQAQLNTQVISDFIVKLSNGIEESAEYLAMMTRALNARYSGCELRSCRHSRLETLSDYYMLTWKEYSELALKQQEVSSRQMFIRALMVIRGMSLERALAVVEKYPTIVSLLSAYEEIQVDEDAQNPKIDPKSKKDLAANTFKSQEQLLANLVCSLNGRRLGPALSKAVCHFLLK